VKLPTEDGIYPGLPRDLYERIPRLNMSKLKHMAHSPFHFRAAELEEEQDTDEKLEGRATHVATFEPERWLATYAIWDGPRRAGNDWKKFCADHAGLEILTEKQRDRVIAIQKAVRSDRYAAPFLEHGLAEVTILWTHVEPPLGDRPGFSIQCKGRIDFANGAISDLKSTRDASPEGFARQSWNLRYHVSAAWYVDGHAAACGGELRPFRMIAVGNRAPHPVQVYNVPEGHLDIGRATYRGWLAQLHDCRRLSRWPGYAEGPIDLGLPKWAVPDDYEEEDATDESDMGLEGLEARHA
jgi:hypothetical protein